MNKNRNFAPYIHFIERKDASFQYALIMYINESLVNPYIPAKFLRTLIASTAIFSAFSGVLLSE